MKKISLMMLGTCLTMIGANAQQLKTTRKSIESSNAEYVLPVAKALPMSTAKTTATGTREYDHNEYVRSISLVEDSSWSCRIWHDSTILQSYISGSDKINYSSVAQVIFPWDNLFNDPTNPNFKGLMKITSTDTYRIDSVKIAGVYRIGNLRPSSIVDTLIISLGQQNFTYSYDTKAAFAPYGDLTPYLDNIAPTSDKDTLRYSRPLAAEAATRTALSYSTAPARVLWKVPLTASMRTTTNTIQVIASAPSGGPYTISAGNVPVVSFTFKSGDTWVPNVSNVDSFHRFMPIFTGTSKIMPYKGRWIKAADHSASALMFSTDPSYYDNPVIIEAQNTPDFRYEYLSASMVMSCASCGIVTSINESTLLSNISAFPNPSNTELNVPFTLLEKAKVTVSLSNMMGQVVATENMGSLNAGQKATATFNTSNLAAGIYLYTVEANGQRVTNRFTVAH